MIINRKKYSKCMFADLLPGDFFTYLEIVYIKVSTHCDDFNAFNCEENTLTSFSNNIVVSRINIELTEV